MLAAIATARPTTNEHIAAATLFDQGSQVQRRPPLALVAVRGPVVVWILT